MNKAVSPETIPTGMTFNREPIEASEVQFSITSMIMKSIGVLATSAKYLPIVEQGLNANCFIYSGLGGSYFAPDMKSRLGDLHRHFEGDLIVHKTYHGFGAAQFYWAVRDFGTYDEDFKLNPAEDELIAQQLDVPVYPDSIIVFPSGAWHRFDTTGSVGRHSRFELWTYRAGR